MADLDHIIVDAPARHFRPLAQDDLIVTTRPLVADGRMLPAGSTGVIIDVSPVRGHYHAEFSAPFHCVAALDDADVRLA